MSDPASLRLELFVKDVAESVAFYRDVLGFVVESEAPDYVAMRLGDVVFGIGPQAGLPAGHHFSAALDQPKGTGVEIVIEVHDIDALYGRVGAAGYPVSTPLKKRPWGLTDFRIVDPDGYFLRPTSRT